MTRPGSSDAAHALDGRAGVPREHLAGGPDVDDRAAASSTTTAASRTASRIAGDDGVGVDGAHGPDLTTGASSQS